MEQTIQPRDMYFQCRMMGSLPPPEHRTQLAQWYQAARANPARVEVGVARIQALLDVLPSDVDLSASEAPPVTQVAAFTMLCANDPCPCESGKTFGACHGLCED